MSCEHFGISALNAVALRARNCCPSLSVGLLAELAYLDDGLAGRSKLHSRIPGHSDCAVYPLATTIRSITED